METNDDSLGKKLKPKKTSTLIERCLNNLNTDRKARKIIDSIKATPKPNLLAIVGSRQAEDLSIEWAKLIAKEAVSRGFIVVSGGARGIDQQAHLEAIHQGGQSIAIIACGLDKLNRRLKNLAQQGVGLASPFLAHHPPQVWTYPKRNKYIAELSDGVVVIQAAVSSGSLLTARHALALGKKVWVLPHHPSQKTFRGSLQLLREGAWPLLSTQSWLDDFKGELTNSPQSLLPSGLDESYPNELKQHASPLWQVSGARAKPLEILALEASMSLSEAMLEATQLELNGWLTLVIGLGYKRAYP